MDYGSVISTFEGPSTRKFSFVIGKDKVVRRGQFIQVDVPDGKLIGRVSDVIKTNRYFSRPESVSEYEKSGTVMNDIFPVSDWECLVAEVAALGVYSDTGFQDSTFPPSPGSRVYEPQDSILEKFFGLDPKGLHIGNLAHHNVDVKINMTRLLQKHLAILALSGAGKSYLTSVLVEELLARKPEQGNLAIVIIDTHGEYSSFAKDPEYSSGVKIFNSNDLRIGISRVSSNNIANFCDLSGSQKRVLYKIFSSFSGGFDLSDVMAVLEARQDVNQATKDVILSELAGLRKTGVFGVNDFPVVTELAKTGQLSIVDLSGFIHMKSKQMLVAHIAKKLFDARRNGIIPPFVIVLEEAHQYIPEKATKQNALSKGILNTIAREGRKFHASLCLISQRPVHLSTTILSQCNTNIILRITNPYDLDHIGRSSEGLTKDVLGQISAMRVGTGLVIGEAVNFPLFVKIRKRKSKDSEKGLPLEEAAKEYHEKVTQKIKDAKEFM